jgi:pimeloyl-ACP methyl ester carboxylesterase
MRAGWFDGDPRTHRVAEIRNWGQGGFGAARLARRPLRFEPLLPTPDLENFTWICPEYRGYERSSHLRGRFTMAEAAADCIEILISEGVKHCYVVGYSMDAKIAQLIVLANATAGRLGKTGLRRQAIA